MPGPVHSPPRVPDPESAAVIALEGPTFAPTEPLRAPRRHDFPAAAGGLAAAGREAILENIGDAIYSLEPDWTVSFFNRQAERFFDCSRSEVLGRSLWDSFPAARQSELGDALREVMRGRAPKTLVIVSPSTGRWTDTRIFPLDDGGLGVSWRDVTAQKQQELALEEAVKTQDLLYRELTHRVSNNFQLVFSRLMLQARGAPDAQVRETFAKIATSVHCMAMVNRRLYRSRDGLVDQDLGAYLEGLAEDLGPSLLPANVALTVSAVRGVRVSADLAATVGVMVAELVTNAGKYAWPAGEPGAIALVMIRDGGTIVLEVRDNGRGLPPGGDLRRSSGIGLRLLERQIAGLGGVFIPTNVASGGASFRLRFPGP